MSLGRAVHEPVTAPNHDDHRLQNTRSTNIDSEPNDPDEPTRLTLYPKDRPATQTEWISGPLAMFLTTEEIR